MLSFKFIPKPLFAERFSGLSSDQKHLLADALLGIVFNFFVGKATGYKNWTKQQEIEIRVTGLAFATKFSRDHCKLNITSKLREVGLDNLFMLSEKVETLTEAFDSVYAPEQIQLPNILSILLSIFGPTQRVPDEFICPITRKIISEPAYLKGEPGKSYEGEALKKIVLEQKKDPLTRESVQLVDDIVENSALKSRINDFVRHVVHGKNTDHFFNPTISVAQAGLFPQPAAAQVAPASLAHVLVECHLTEEFNTVLARALKVCHLTEEFDAVLARVLTAPHLAEEYDPVLAKALRRAANVGNFVFMEIILSKVLPERQKLIVDQSDPTLSSQKTPLHLAVQKGHVAAARWLLDHGADLDKANAQGMTCRRLIAESDHAEIRSLVRVTTAVTPS